MNFKKEDLADMIAQILPEREIQWDSHFFKSGGNSLSAARLVFRVNQSQGIQLGIRDVVKSPSLEDLYKEIVAKRNEMDKKEKSHVS